MKRIAMLCAALAAIAAGAKDALADGVDCGFIGQEYDRLSPALREEAEVVALAQHLTERCRAGATSAEAAVAQLRARAQDLQEQLEICQGILSTNCGQSRRLNTGECGRLCDADPHGSWSGTACTCEAGWHTPRRNPCVCVRNTPPSGGRRRTPPPPPVRDASGLCPHGTAMAGSAAPGDRDCDSVVDARDNCVWTHNPTQEDSDGDGIGASCDDRDDLAVHGTDLAPLAARITELEERLRTHNHSDGGTVVAPGDGLPDDIRRTLVARWVEIMNVLDHFNELATTVGDHTRQIAALRQDLDGLTGRVDGLERRILGLEDWRNNHVDPALDNLQRENQRQDGELSDFRRMLTDLRARVFPYLWVDGAALVFPGSGNTVVAPTAEFGLRIATFGPFAVSGSIGFGAADGQFAIYYGGLGEFLLNDPNRPAHFSLGLGFAAFANEGRAFGNDQYGWRGVYLEPAAFIRLGDGERAPRIRLAIRAGLGQSFWRQNAPTEWGQAGMVGASLGIAFRGL